MAEDVLSSMNDEAMCFLSFMDDKINIFVVRMGGLKKTLKTLALCPSLSARGRVRGQAGVSKLPPSLSLARP